MSLPDPGPFPGLLPVTTADALLTRQLAKAQDASGAFDMGRFLALVERTYAEKDQEARRANRAQRVMSEELDSALSSLAMQNLRFKAALDHMRQGLCLTDPAGRLAVCNRRFLDLYGLMPEDAVPGTPLRDVLAGARALTDLTPLDRTRLIDSHLALDAEGGGTTEQSWPGGRRMAISRQPVADGGHLDMIEDVTEARRASARIAWLASHDPLTDLANRATLRDELTDLARGGRAGRQHALLCLDLDKFKAVNDTYGHPVGDSLLIAVARRILAETRGTDTVARLGGDEFAVILRNVAGPTEAEAVANRICKVLADPFSVAGRTLNIGVSIGIEMLGEAGSDPDRLMMQADLALYHAKETRKGHYIRYHPSMLECVSRRHLFEVELGQALDRDEISVAFLPQVEGTPAGLTGFEAQAVWTHPERGPIAAPDFMALAESSGQADRLVARVMLLACREAATWPAPLRLFVAIRPRPLQTGIVVTATREALAATGLPPDRLELTLSEIVLSAEPGPMLDQLKALRALGPRIALTDFGKDRSLFGFARNFRFDRVRIDRAFMDSLPDPSSAPVVVRAVTELCSSLGMELTTGALGQPAEGEATAPGAALDPAAVRDLIRDLVPLPG